MKVPHVAAQKFQKNGKKTTIFGPTVLWKLTKLKSKTVFFILPLLLKLGETL